MNAIYNLGARLEIAKRWGQERLAGEELDNKRFNDFFDHGPLTEFFRPPDMPCRACSRTAPIRWALWAPSTAPEHRPLQRGVAPPASLAGGKPISPIPINVAQANSSYWQATERQTPFMAAFFLKAGKPDRLKDAPGGEAFLTKDQAVLERGKLVFAERCARCHSSKIGTRPGLDPTGCAGPNYLQCWNQYWGWTKTDDFKGKMREIVLAPDFLDGNYLSTDLRMPVTLLQTNACSPLATNAIRGNIWDNFSSQSYKELPSVGTVTVHHPITGEPRQYRMPADGRGYTRPPTLVSLWSTAPYL